MLKPVGLLSGFPISVNAADLEGTPVWKPDDGITTNDNGLNRLCLLIVSISWASLAGGDGTSNCKLRAVQGATEAKAQDESSYLTIKSTHVTLADNAVLFVDNAADGSATLHIMYFGGSTGGMLLPFDLIAQLKLLNEGTAYTAGTVNIDSVEAWALD
jgi:hypothetical protein